MSESGQGREPSGSQPQFRRPAALFFEPPAEPADEEHFFSLESINDPHELLGRATELATAFQSAADRSVEYQAMAAAQLADPTRFDRLTPAAIADRAGWTEDYAVKMIEFGRGLLGRRA
ncbi:hypothetical protein RM844_04695 [Streptomyces sp. DSM 44915]|uniref:Uncharacterized protein n=1 Tax=Streptomyces chisholmiae TaxID=3075540 RepID=A0ABU2JKS8_9ACTN|nr:hypothetical protein [Streptomyces sp. DSM 44915]MDT0265586.1 hypothetical protein [Streptomyces sp. DSM 44915]